MRAKEALPFLLYIPLFVCLSMASGSLAFPEPMASPSPGPSGSPSPNPSPMPSPMPSASPSPVPAEKPTLVAEKGKPYQLVFKDGRVGTLMISRNAPVSFPMSIDFFENTCTGQLEKCAYHVGFELDRVAMKWTANPDPSKIGKTLVLKTGTNQNELTTDHQLSVADKTFSPIISRKIPDDEISCADFSILPGGSPGRPPASTWISRWDSEIMLSNPETEAMENRSIGGALDVELVATDHQTVQLVLRQYYTSAFGGGPTGVPAGDVVGWQIRQASGEFCQMSFRPDINSVLTLFQDYQKNLKDHFETYIFGTDEYSEGRRLNMFHYFLDTNMEFEIL